MRKVSSFALALTMCVATTATVQAAPTGLDALSFLLGTWVTANADKPGVPYGSATFARDLLDRVITRRSSAATDPVGDGPTFHHEDLMVIRADASGAIQADFYDSEGHVIRYTVTVPAPGTASFVSDAAPGAPRYRLTYRLGDDGRLAGRFEIAPPGKPEEFAPYLAWTSTRS
jgi:hypothetical protein